MVSMGERNTRIGGATSRCSYTWDYLKRDVFINKTLNLLTASTKDKWITTFQPKNALTFFCEAKE